MRQIWHGENSAVLPQLPAAFARLVYVDPPFNTGRAQKRDRITVVADETGTRGGFGGKRYRQERAAGADLAFDDAREDYVAFLIARVELALRCTTDDASIFVHVDPRESHYVKVALDGLLGRERFVNEIVWAYDFGGRPQRAWPRKHDVLFWYVRDPERYVFERDAIDRVPYMAPDLVGPEKAAKGKIPTDVWWHTIVPTNGREKTGYPTQKPLGVLERIVKVHSQRGDVVLDFFAGSGTTGVAAARHGRGFVLVDESSDAIDVMAKRLAEWEPQLVNPEGSSRKSRTSGSG